MSKSMPKKVHELMAGIDSDIDTPDKPRNTRW